MSSKPVCLHTGPPYRPVPATPRQRPDHRLLRQRAQGGAHAGGAEPDRARRGSVRSHVSGVLFGFDSNKSPTHAETAIHQAPDRDRKRCVQFAKRLKWVLFIKELFYCVFGATWGKICLWVFFFLSSVFWPVNEGKGRRRAISARHPSDTLLSVWLV